MFTTVKKDDLHKLATDILVKCGETAENAEIIYDNLIEDEYQGKRGHGFYRLPQITRAYSNGTVITPVEVMRDGNKVEVKGNKNIGLVAMNKAVDAVIDAAKDERIVVASVYGYQNTTGAIGYYARKLARAGLVAMVAVTCDVSVAPHGSMEPHLATNPIAFAFPAGNNPVVTDVATSASPYGYIALQHKNGLPVPLGHVLDRNGNDTTDPADAVNMLGVQLPLAGHKGYSLGLAFELLAGVFIGVKSGTKTNGYGDDGALIIAMRPDTFISKGQFDENMALFIDEIKNAKPRPDMTVRLPGMYDEEKYDAMVNSDEFEIMSEVYKDLLALKEKLGA